MTLGSSRTNGFLFADLRDYTRYVEAHGDQAAAVLLEAYRALVRSSVAEFGGAEIKTEGDSFYVVFPSASSAVQCGLAILVAASDPPADRRNHHPRRHRRPCRRNGRNDRGLRCCRPLSEAPRSKAVVLAARCN
jgi:class 3 adenylate cyclase